MFSPSKERHALIGDRYVTTDGIDFIDEIVGGTTVNSHNACEIR